MRDLGEQGRRKVCPFGYRVLPFGYRCQMGREGANGFGVRFTGNGSWLALMAGERVAKREPECRKLSAVSCQLWAGNDGRGNVRAVMD
jgi:hypothetical protein